MSPSSQPEGAGFEHVQAGASEELITGVAVALLFPTVKRCVYALNSLRWHALQAISLDPTDRYSRFQAAVLQMQMGDFEVSPLFKFALSAVLSRLFILLTSALCLVFIQTCFQGKVDDCEILAVKYSRCNP